MASAASGRVCPSAAARSGVRCGASQRAGSASQWAYPVDSATRRVAVPGVASGRTPPDAALGDWC
ncbi:hypothetical protein DDQ41_23605 [Streptomyces spongiicola]|uniref:Uncharacterized protein n=1 Tax=Streptomyces spongiicola TaxID=1690221 RepID=A0ABN5L1R7_9ACTN|nr:hypothetical protein DDQ41_23605 [Streptomyces spongiicola]